MRQVFNCKILLALTFLGLFFAAASNAQPVCPICVVVVGAGLGFSRWLGIDDVVSSIWIGALLIAFVIWTAHWIRKKRWDFKFSGAIIFILYYAFTYIPLYYFNIIGHPLNKIFGVDKIIFGSALGTVVFLAGVWFNNFLKARNKGKQFFIYQKVVLPVSILIIISLILWMII